MIHIFYASFDARYPDGIWHRFLNRMRPDFSERLRRFVKWEDQQRGLLGRILLMEGMTYWGLSHTLLDTMQFTRYGRPFLDCPIDFNISHSGQYAVCILADTGRVGIDVEKIRSIELNHFEKQFRPQEWHVILEANDPYDMFFAYWTMKESIIKADGKGLSIPLKDIVIHENKALLDQTEWFLTPLSIDNNYKFHFAADPPPREYRIHRIDPMGWLGMHDNSE